MIDRQKEKQLSRDKDQEDLESGRKLVNNCKKKMD
jgi:hypothetical protein